MAPNSKVRPNGALAEKVFKLLSLANHTSTNPHEAAQALEHANRLALRYGLDLSAINGPPEASQVVQQTIKRGVCRNVWVRLAYVHATLRDHFKVRPFSFAGNVVVLGLPHDTDVAIYVHEFLDNVYKDAWRSYRRRMGEWNREHEHSCYMGLRDQYDAMLREQAENREQELPGSTDLVVQTHTALDEAEAALDLVAGKTKRRNITRAAYYFGMAHAKENPILPAIPDQGRGHLALPKPKR